MHTYVCRYIYIYFLFFLLIGCGLLPAIRWQMKVLQGFPGGRISSSWWSLLLGGGDVHPFEKDIQIGSSPQVGIEITNVSNHRQEKKCIHIFIYTLYT